MKVRASFYAPLLVALLFALGGGCTDADIQPAENDPPNVVDNLLEVTGTICTETPENTVFPVKILLVIDTSGSMQCTDENNFRVTAVQELVNRFAGRPGMFMSLIRFNESIDVSDNTGDGIADFIGDPLSDPAFTGVLQRLNTADGPTNYQGGLTAAYNAIFFDVSPSGLDTFVNPEAPRTKYVIIFFSDGAPDPQCSATMPDPFLFCETARMDWADIGLDPADPNLWFSYTDGDDFNQPYQILNIVDDIMSLQTLFGIGEIRLHTAYLHPPTYMNGNCSGWDVLFNTSPAVATILMQDMATAGNGTFTDYYAAMTISFLSYDYTSIEVPFSLVNLLATNTNALPAVDHFTEDSDGDGVDDDTEFAYDNDATDAIDPRLVSDFDGDDWPDLFEVRNLERGFDPADPGFPLSSCDTTAPGGVAGAFDSDNDGLLNCEEFLLGSDTALADTDRDRFHDTIEYRFGLDPAGVDLTGDVDNDGIFNSDEMLFHSDPLTSDPGVWEELRYWTELNELPRDPDGRICYDFTIRNISLVTTLETPNHELGTNDVYIYATEAPQGDALDYGTLRVACVRVRYVAPDFKNPIDGIMEVDELNFVDLADFDPDLDCLTP